MFTHRPRFWGGLMTLLLLCIGVVAALWFVPEIGRIGGFRPLTANTELPGTNYRIDFEPLANQATAIWLENHASPSKLSLFENLQLQYGVPSFSLFTYQGRQYLITRAANTGSADSWWYRVYDVSTDTPQEQTVTDPDVGLMQGAACNDPKLDGQGLLFEGGEKCKIFVFFVSPFSHEYQYHLKLQPH